MFKFTLERVKDYREQIVDSITIEYQKLHSKLKSEENKLFELRDKYFETKDQLMKEITKGQYKKQAMYDQFLNGLKISIIEQLTAMHTIRSDLEIKQLELIEAKKAKSMLDKIKEKEEAQYLKKESQQEQELNDEIATFRHIKARTN